MNHLLEAAGTLSELLTAFSPPIGPSLKRRVLVTSGPTRTWSPCLQARSPL